MTKKQVARICHEANREYCEQVGDTSQRTWDDAAEWQRESAIKGVAFAIDNPGAAPAAQHDAWMADKIADGWKFGPLKDAGLKEHPCIVPYTQLPEEQQIKDHLFRGIVWSLAAFIR